MYLSIERYPKERQTTKGKRQVWEQLYRSKHVVERVGNLQREVYERDMNILYMMNYLQVSRPNLTKIIKNQVYPSLRIYLKLGEIFGWDLSQDVNYAYAEVLYPPKEILRRWRRIFGPGLSARTIARNFAPLPPLLDMYEASLIYGEKRHLTLYGKLMMKLSLYEHIEGYDDALSFEE